MKQIQKLHDLLYIERYINKIINKVKKYKIYLRTKKNTLRFILDNLKKDNTILPVKEYFKFLIQHNNGFYINKLKIVDYIYSLIIVGKIFIPVSEKTVTQNNLDNIISIKDIINNTENLPIDNSIIYMDNYILNKNLTRRW